MFLEDLPVLKVMLGDILINGTTVQPHKCTGYFLSRLKRILGPKENKERVLTSMICVSQEDL